MDYTLLIAIATQEKIPDFDLGRRPKLKSVELVCVAMIISEMLRCENVALFSPWLVRFSGERLGTVHFGRHLHTIGMGEGSWSTWLVS